ncbi:HET-domain-containing protein [Acephala macrosclerotiorum]|nr:HET-domain-containing protein [Acephala macrosclerotiorum]
MWLLNTTTLQLEYVNSSEERSYAALSHTWEDDEVSFQEMAALDQARKKKGFSKISWTCRLALERGIKYAWIDTCCIDKLSSAELTEAINSMFKWYKDSTVCFAFLSDLHPSNSTSKAKKVPTDELGRCRWFTRGWTLQELIAPDVVEFYDQSWILRGDKSSSRSQLFEITGIDIKVLTDSDKLSTIPVARRMSWASMRQTTRVEDLAYCLFGIFDVNLPLIYGEGLKAFIRLQEGIVRETFDLSMFAWMSGHGDQQFRGIFARSPYEFRNCGSIVMVADPSLQTTRFEMTHRGINFTTSLISLEGDETGYYLLNLNCRHSGVSKRDEIHGAIMIPLVRIRNGYVRYYSRTLVVISLLQYMTHEYEASRNPHRNTAQVHVPKMIGRAQSDLIAVHRAHRFSIRIKNSTRWRISAKHFHPENLWHSTSNSFATGGQDGFTAAIDIFLEGKTWASEWNPTTGKDDVEWLDVWWPSFHISLGLAQLVSQGKDMLDESDSELEPLEPWAAIYRNNTYSTLGFGLSPQDRGRASQFRKQAEQLPTALNLNHPYIQQTRSHTTEARRYSKEHSLLLSVSTNILPHRESGMYELVLSIKEDGWTGAPIRFGTGPCLLTAHTQKTPAKSLPPRPLKLPEEQQPSTRRGLLSFFG